MTRIRNLALYSFRELMGMLVVRITLTAAALLPLAAWIFSEFFLMELTKVQLDVMTAGSYLLGMVLILIAVVPMLGADIGGRLCYFYLVPPVSRNEYVLGRFLGAALLLLLLFAVLLAGSETLITVALEYAPADRRHGIDWETGLLIAGTACYQSMTLLAAVFFIAAWATGFAELLLFSIAACALFWIMPPVLEAMKNPFLMEGVPAWIVALVHGIAWLLPEMNAGQFILAELHGQATDYTMLLLHFLGHLGYVLIMLMACLLIFARRDL